MSIRRGNRLLGIRGEESGAGVYRDKMFIQDRVVRDEVPRDVDCN